MQKEIIYVLNEDERMIIPYSRIYLTRTIPLELKIPDDFDLTDGKNIYKLESFLKLNFKKLSYEWKKFLHKHGVKGIQRYENCNYDFEYDDEYFKNPSKIEY